MRALRYLGFFLVVCAAIAGVAALAGALIAYFHGDSYAKVIAWSE